MINLLKLTIVLSGAYIGTTMIHEPFIIFMVGAATTASVVLIDKSNEQER